MRRPSFTVEYVAPQEAVRFLSAYDMTIRILSGCVPPDVRQGLQYVLDFVGCVRTDTRTRMGMVDEPFWYTLREARSCWSPPCLLPGTLEAEFAAAFDDWYRMVLENERQSMDVPTGTAEGGATDTGGYVYLLRMGRHNVGRPGWTLDMG